MRIFSILFSILCITSSALAEKAPSADELAHRAVDILGGEALEHARYFSYTFVVEKKNGANAFPQQWDRLTGDYHVTGRRPDDMPFEATINVKTGALKSGAIMGRTSLSDEERKRLFQWAYERYVSDTFWLMMPLMMLDPQFRREYDGPRNDTCGRTWDLLRLTVEVKPGNPPAGVYWPWINRDTGMVEEWDMKPAGLPKDSEPLRIIFHDYRRIGGLLISLRREVRTANQTVRFDKLQILPQPPKDAFNQ